MASRQINSENQTKAIHGPASEEKVYLLARKTYLLRRAVFFNPGG